MTAAPDSTSPDATDSSGTSEAAGGADAIGSRLMAPVAEEDEASLALVILRDVALASVLLTLFGAAETWSGYSGLALAALVATVIGLLVGAATGALAHEWGHFAGARLGGGHAPLKPIRGLLPLFDFDYRNNASRAFEWMSIGGNLAHWAVVLLFLIAVPTTTAGSAALAAGAIGFAVFSSAVEFPVIRKARAGASGVEALASIPRDFVQRYLPAGLGAAALAFLIL